VTRVWRDLEQPVILAMSNVMQPLAEMLRMMPEVVQAAMEIITKAWKRVEKVMKAAWKRVEKVMKAAKKAQSNPATSVGGIKTVH